MKLFFNILILTLFGASAFAASQSNLKVDKLVIGEATSVTKTIELNMGLGSANPKIKTNSSTNKMQFANDGTTYKDFGSGSGGGGGTNLIPNYDFESGVSGWTTSGVTLTQQSYGAPGDGNLKYVSATATVVGSYFETSTITVPDFLRGADLESVGIYTSQNGQWRVDVFTSGSVTTSQTLASQTAWTDETKIYFPAGQTTTKKRYTLVSVSGTSTLTIDDSYLGSTRSLKNGAVVTPETTYTPTTTQGFGAISSAEVYYSIRGDKMLIRAKFTIGTLEAGEVRFGLPNGFVTASTAKIPTIQKAGAWIQDSSGSVGGQVLVEPGVTYLTFSTQNGTQSGLTKFTTGVGNFNGGKLSFVAEFPIDGMGAGNTTFDFRCPNDISCENDFSALATAGGGITSQSLGFLSSCTNTATGQYSCSFGVGVFTVAPTCSLQIATNTNNSQSANISSITNSTVAFALNAGGVNTNLPFILQCKKQIGDFVAKRSVEGFMSKTVTSTGNFIERMERVNVSTNCTASPCTISSQSGGISSVTRTSTGNYVVNFVAGTFSSAATCTATAANGSTSVIVTASPASNIAYGFSTNTDAGVVTDSHFSVICMGPR